MLMALEVRGNEPTKPRSNPLFLFACTDSSISSISLRFLRGVCARGLNFDFDFDFFSMIDVSFLFLAVTLERRSFGQGSRPRWS
jgi:hypothetical protein